MSQSAFQAMYRAEYIAGFEVHQSLLRTTVVTDTFQSGNQYYFLVADSGGAQATTRGLNGLIQGRSDNLTQTPIQMSEWHDKPQKTRFNIISSQGNQREIMQKTSMSVINRKIDQQILDALGTATVGANDAPMIASLTWVMRAKVRLGNAKVVNDGQIFAVITPAAEGYLMQIPEFASSMYTKNGVFDKGDTGFRDQGQAYYRWAGVNWIVDPSLPGVGTNNASCYMYHRNAIGHAAPEEMMQVVAGYNEEEDYSFARTTLFAGAGVIQNAGIVVMPHDDSGLS